MSEIKYDLIPGVTIEFGVATEAELREARHHAFHAKELRALGERIYGNPAWGAWPEGALAELEAKFPYPWPLEGTPGGRWRL